jgi:hypothetical protein
MRWTFELRLTSATRADGEIVWFRHPKAGVTFAGSKTSRGQRWQKCRAHRGERVIIRKPLRREGRMPPLHLYARVRLFHPFCTRDRGCSVHPVFPAPLCPENLSDCANGRLPTNRPLLELSPLRPKATEPVSERGTAPVSSSTRTVARASSPNRARKGVDDGTR